PCQSNSGYFALGLASFTYCTYICSTSKSPLGSTLIGAEPAVNTTSLVGTPESETGRPPTWKLPISATDRLSATAPAAVARTRARLSTKATRRMDSSVGRGLYAFGRGAVKVAPLRPPRRVQS